VPLALFPRRPCDTEIVVRTDIISSFDVNLEKQEVRVTGDAEYETVLAMIQKTGKTVRSPIAMIDWEKLIRAGQGAVWQDRHGRIDTNVNSAANGDVDSGLDFCSETGVIAEKPIG
jgi:hypothetical protein